MPAYALPHRAQSCNRSIDWRPFDELQTSWDPQQREIAAKSISSPQGGRNTAGGSWLYFCVFNYCLTQRGTRLLRTFSPRKAEADQCKEPDRYTESLLKYYLAHVDQMQAPPLGQPTRDFVQWAEHFRLWWLSSHSATDSFPEHSDIIDFGEQRRKKLKQDQELQTLNFFSLSTAVMSLTQDRRKDRNARKKRHISWHRLFDCQKVSQWSLMLLSAFMLPYSLDGCHQHEGSNPWVPPHHLCVCLYSPIPVHYVQCPTPWFRKTVQASTSYSSLTDHGQGSETVLWENITFTARVYSQKFKAMGQVWIMRAGIEQTKKLRTTR